MPVFDERSQQVALGEDGADGDSGDGIAAGQEPAGAIYQVDAAGEGVVRDLSQERSPLRLRLIAPSFGQRLRDLPEFGQIAAYETVDASSRQLHADRSFLLHLSAGLLSRVPSPHREEGERRRHQEQHENDDPELETYAWLSGARAPHQGKLLSMSNNSND